jgi:3-oxocholest-4-en-26-oyl-CoA dehydrogenase beta subunit
MNYDFTNEQNMLKKSAREFFTKEVNSELVRELEADEKGYSAKIYGKMAQLGWLGMLVPETYGGEGMDFVDLTAVLEELGASAMPGPYFTSAVVSALTLVAAATDAQKKKWLPNLCNGKKIYTLACEEKNTAMSPVAIKTKAELKGDQYEITGNKWFVPFAHVSDYIITVVRTADADANGNGGISLFVIDRTAPGVKIEVIKTSTADKLCELTLDKVAVSKDNLVGKANAGWEVLAPVLHQCGVAKSAEMVGACDKVLKMAVDYAKNRVQFGRPIGSFQAIQHHCANMKTFSETSMLITHQAAWRIATGEGWEKEAAMCKSYTSEALKGLMMLAHQVTGGFGFMEEADYQLYYRRVRSAEVLFGTSTYYREIVAEKMGL